MERQPPRHRDIHHAGRDPGPVRPRAVAVHAPLLRCAHTTALPAQRTAPHGRRLDGEPNVLMDHLAGSAEFSRFWEIRRAWRLDRA
jgi:hypothetical protein